MAISKTTKRIDIASLYQDGNPRTERGMKLDSLCASYVNHGWQPESTIMVEDKDEQGFLVLRGNRRTSAAKLLQDNDPDAFNRIFSDGKIPAIVCRDLTDQERILLRIDHSDEMDREPLDDEGLFNAVSQLAKAGLTQEKIATHLNLWKTEKKSGKRVPNRSLVQRRVELAKLPQRIQDEYRQLMQKGLDATPVRWSMIPALYKEFSKTFDTAPDGTIEFWEKWDKCCTPSEDKAEKGKSPGGRALSPKKATEKAQLAQSKSIRDLMLCVVGLGEKTFDEIDKAVVLAETAQITLGKIQAYLGDDDYQNFLTEVFTAEKVEA